MAADVCPPTDDLERFLLGDTDEVAARRLETHLNTCSGCSCAALRLAAADDWVRALAGVGALEPQPLVDLLLPHLKRIPDSLRQTIPPVASPQAETFAWVHQPTRPARSRESLPQRADIERYEIRGELGRGGMGVVLEAYDPQLQRSIAIKVLQAERFAGAEAAERFLAEARAAAAVEHDHITPVYAIEMLAGAPCIVMPLLRGQSLQQRLATTHGPLPTAEVLQIGIETAAGLAAAHARGLVHRDIKPANLWLEAPQERVKILDFGLALVRSDAAAEVGEIAGTPGFLAPEQAQGKTVDARTDLFSLGCVLYLAATSRAAFSGPPKLRTLWTVLSEPPPLAGSINREIPAKLSALIARLLARRPEDRPASADAVRDELQAIARRPQELLRQKTRRRWLAALIAVAACSALAVGLWAAATMQTVLAPVDVTLRGDPATLRVILEHEGREIAADLAGARKLELAPGDYFLRPVQAEAGRTLVPARFTVLPETPLTVHVAHVGEIARHETHSQPVSGVAILGDSETVRVFSVSLDRTLVAWDGSETGSPKFFDVPQATRCLAVGPNGSELAFAGGNKFPPAELSVQRRRTADLEPQGSPLAGHTRVVTAVAYAPNGNVFASAAADGVFLWDLAAESRQHLPESADRPFAALTFSADGKRVLAATEDGALLLWDVASTRLLKTLVVGNGQLHAIASLADSFVIGGADGVVRSWDQVTFEARTLYEHSAAVRSLATSADGRLLLSGDSDGGIRVYSLPSGRALAELTGHHGPVEALAVTADGRQAVSGGADRSVRRWRLPFPPETKQGLPPTDVPRRRDESSMKGSQE